MQALNHREKMELGRLATTPGALEALQTHGVSPHHLLVRHQAVDWEICIGRPATGILFQWTPGSTATPPGLPSQGVSWRVDEMVVTTSNLNCWHLSCAGTAVAGDFKKENLSGRGKADSGRAAYGAAAQGYETRATHRIVWHPLDHVSDDQLGIRLTMRLKVGNAWTIPSFEISARNR